jgi:hypothetical protein
MADSEATSTSKHEISSLFFFFVVYFACLDPDSIGIRTGSRSGSDNDENTK